MTIGTEMGEYIVGAYLNVIEECDFVNYNVHPPGGGTRGLDEFDVIAFNHQTHTVFICEVTTHIRGLLYKNYDTTVKRIREKFKKQRSYADEWLAPYRKKRFMFWSPVVSSGLVTRLKRINGLELVINEDYSEKIDALNHKAKIISNDTGNPAFRMFQILEHMRR